MVGKIFKKQKRKVLFANLPFPSAFYIFATNPMFKYGIYFANADRQNTPI